MSRESIGISLWSSDTFRPSRVIREPWEYVSLDGVRESAHCGAIAASRNGKFVAGGIVDGTVAVWRTLDGSLAGVLGTSSASKIDTVRVDALRQEFSNEDAFTSFRASLGKTNAKGDSMTVPEELTSFHVDGRRRAPSRVFFVQDDTAVAWLYHDSQHVGQLRIWTIEPAKELVSLSDIGFIHDASTTDELIVTSNDGDVTSVNVATGKQAPHAFQKLAHRELQHFIASTNSGRSVIATGLKSARSANVGEHDSATGAIIAIYQARVSRNGRSDFRYRVSPDGRWLAVSNHQHGVCLWRIAPD